MNMLTIRGDAVELWVTETDTYTSTKTGGICASVQSIAPIPGGARGNVEGFEINEYNIEPTLLDTIVFEGQPVPCKLVSVVHPTQGRFGWITDTQVLMDLLVVGSKPVVPIVQAPARPQAQTQAPRPAQQPQGQDKQGKPPDAKT